MNVTATLGTSQKSSSTGETWAMLESEGEIQTQTIHAGGTSYGSGGPPEVHFGLGDHDLVRRLTLVWPNGQTSDFQNVDARRGLRVRHYR